MGAEMMGEHDSIIEKPLANVAPHHLTGATRRDGDIGAASHRAASHIPRLRTLAHRHTATHQSPRTLVHSACRAKWRPPANTSHLHTDTWQADFAGLFLYSLHPLPATDAIGTHGHRRILQPAQRLCRLASRAAKSSRPVDAPPRHHRSRAAGQRW